MNRPGLLMVCWSEEDGEYVAACVALPSLSYLHRKPHKALKGLVRIIRKERLLELP